MPARRPDPLRGDERAARRLRAAWAPVLSDEEQPTMPDEAKRDEPKRAAPASKRDAGQAEVQARADEEQDQGFVGQKVDPTPNHAYTVGGVTGGEPTPETDAETAEQARKAAEGRG